MIESVKVLDMLPERSIVIDANGHPWVKGDGTDGWFIWFYDFGDPATEVPLPARLVWNSKPLQVFIAATCCHEGCNRIAIAQGEPCGYAHDDEGIVR